MHDKGLPCPPAAYLRQAIFALWLARFRFGPMEWVWRSLTYGQAQPMRRDTAQGQQAPAAA